MNIKVNVNLGNASYQFEFGGDKEIESLHKAFVFGDPPRKCTCCQSDQVGFGTNKNKTGDTFLYVLCRKCGAKCKLGLYKAGGYFWHGKFEKYSKDDESEASAANRQPAQQGGSRHEPRF